MKRKNLEKFEKTLEENEYKITNRHLIDENYYWYKPFHKEDNVWEEDRAGYQIFFKIYDFSQFSYPNSTLEDNIVISILIMVSRTVAERLDLEMSYDKNMNISDIENKAESFYKWVLKEYPEPKKD